MLESVISSELVITDSFRLSRVHHWNDHHQYHVCWLNDGRNDHNTDRGQNTSPNVGPFNNMSLSGSFRGPYSLCGTKQGLAFNTPNTSQSSRTIQQSTSRNTREHTTIPSKSTPRNQPLHLNNKWICHVQPIQLAFSTFLHFITDESQPTSLTNSPSTPHLH